MVRPPWSEKGGVKKGPWTPEEDVILLSYIQDHGPGNWSSIPAATGLLRCSKSCRLRWTNYLRPGIKRGNFTPHEEGMIIHLQALLGNKWAAIATYLPQRTDNDIKNFWNSHLKKRIKKHQSVAMAPQSVSVHGSKTYNVAEDSSAYAYASSAENVSAALQTWITSSSSSLEGNTMATDFDHNTSCHNFGCDSGKIPAAFCDEMQWCRQQGNGIASDDHELEKNPSLDQGLINGSGTVDQEKVQFFHEEEIDGSPPFSILEDWLLEENGDSQGEGGMEINLPILQPARETDLIV